MTDRSMDRDDAAGADNLGDRDPLAGSANMPPFDPAEPESSAGRPPSHREFDSPADTGREAMEGLAPASGSQQQGDRGFSEEREKLRDSAEGAVDRARGGAESLADRIDDAAGRVHERAGEYRDDSGWRGDASRWADRAAESGSDAADFLRDAGVDDFRALVERQVRDRPLQTILVAAATGWLVGKILR